MFFRLKSTDYYKKITILNFSSKLENEIMPYAIFITINRGIKPFREMLLASQDLLVVRWENQHTARKNQSSTK